MTNSRKIVICSIVFGVLATQAFAFSINRDLYFAYAVHEGTMPYTLTLSHQACTAEKAPASAKSASVIFPMRGDDFREMPACWYIEKYDNGQELVAVCTTLGGKMDGGAAACYFASPSRFLDVMSLPYEANLQ